MSPDELPSLSKVYLTFLHCPRKAAHVFDPMTMMTERRKTGKTNTKTKKNRKVTLMIAKIQEMTMKFTERDAGPG